MIHSRRFPRRLLLGFALRSFAIGAVWATLVVTAYALSGWQFLRVPFLPISTIGIAVAFYIGFKNNSAYDRFWEGRKIWGGVVNTSRAWATGVLSYVRPSTFGDETHRIRQDLIYRQLAWINALRLQLRKTSRFHHKPAPSTARRLKKHADVMRNDWNQELSPFLDHDELQRTEGMANTAAQLLTEQGARLAAMKEAGQLDLFHQIDLMAHITELYGLQGKAERIKATPFPRQYAEYSRVFTRTFVFLVPFGLLDVFASHIDAAVGPLQTISPIIPMVIAAGLITWVFITMEGIGDSSEDPFERSMNDVPMNALCRVIERDLRQMLGESNIPEPEQPVDHILY